MAMGGMARSFQRRWHYAAGAALLSLALFARDALAAPFTAQEQEGRIEIRFENLPLANAAINEAQNEIALKFSAPVPDGVFSALETSYPQWIAFSFSGYDSAVVRASRPVTFKAVADGSGFVLTLATGSAVTAPEGGGVSADPVEVQKARLLSEAGEAGAARAAFGRLIDMHPRDTALRRAAGDAEMRAGNPADALSHYDAAIALSPDDASLRAARAQALRDIGSFIRGGTDWQFVEDADTQVQSDVEGRIHLGGGVSIAFSGENRIVEDYEVQAPVDGSLQPYDDTRQRGEVSLVYARDGFEVRAGATGQIGGEGGSEVGAVAALLRRTPDDEVELRATWREPWWETTSGIRFNGVRDGASLTYARQITPSLSAHAGLRIARYGIDGEDDVARTWGFSAGLRKTWRAGRETEVSLGYGVDGDYLIARETRLDGFLQPYYPIDIDDSETHALDLSLGTLLAPGLRADAYAGFAYDRFGSNGPFGGLALTWSPGDNVDLTLSASHSAVSGRSGEEGAVTRAGASLTWRFAPPGNE